MTRNYIEVDIERWPRKATFEFFRGYDDPFFNLTANVDVTALRGLTKQRGFSFSLAALYCVLEAVDRIPEFRMRFVDDKLVEFETIHATQTLLNDDETFCFGYFEFSGTLAEFDAAGKRAVEHYRGLNSFDVETERLDLIYCSALPWVSFTSFKHASRIDRTQSVPRVVFGKVFDQGAREMMPVSVEVNHAIMDGLHVGRFYAYLQQAVDRSER